MDNGQSGGNAKKIPIFSGSDPEDQAFFTPGVGNESPENNDIEPEINLDEENWQKSLEISAPAGLPTPEELAAKTVSKTETIESPAENSTDSATDTDNYTPVSPTLEPAKEPVLGHVTPVEAKKTSQDVAKPYNPANIKTEGDYLDKNSLAEIEKLEDKLSQDGDLNSFYDLTRDLTEVNLDNSFSRKLYQDGGDK